MFGKITKITLKTGEKYFLFVFLAVFLSLFSYILGNNIVLSVKDYLVSQIKPIVGADIVLSSNSSSLKDEKVLDKYQKDFEIAKTISINSTIFDKTKKPVLVEIVYHSKNYPFYNQFEYDIINSSGSVILKNDLYEKFSSQINIFSKDYKVLGLIKKSPLGNVNMYTSQNTLYLPIEEFQNTLNSTNSRIEYNYYLKQKNPNSNINLDEIKKDINLKDLRIRTINDRNENISNITDRFYLFINFFNLCVFVLTFFVVILSLETYFKKIKGTIGLLNIFGMKKTKIFLYNFLVLFGVFFVALVLAFLGNILIMKFFSLSYDFFEFKENSIFKGIIVCIILFLVGVFSPAFKIYKANISSLLKDEGNFSNFTFKDYLLYLGLIFSGFLVINLVSEIGVFYSFLYSFLFIFIIVLFYILIEKILIKIFGFIKNKNFYLFDAIRSTVRPGNVSFLIIFSSIISFISIFIFYVFSGSFLNYLQNITKNSNDTFVINVQGKDIKTINKYFSNDEIYEIVTLRIKEINGKSLKDFLNTPNVPREFGREFFSTTKTLDNKIISGEKLSSGGVSVDREFANNLGLKLGDEIVFSVAGFEKKLVVQNLREAVRNGTNPFFFFQLFPGDFEKYPKNYILSYKSENKPKNLELTLSKEVGNYLTFIKATEIIAIVIDIASKILLVVYLCLGYIFIFSFLSFLVSVSFLSTFKTNKIRLLNILGGNFTKLVKYFKVEFLYLVFVGLVFSLVFGSLFLVVIFYFIKYFSLNFMVYFYGILILIFLFLVFYIYLNLINTFSNIKK